MDEVLPRVTAPRIFVAPEAVHLGDVWQTSIYDSLCFSGKRWQLLVEERHDLPRLKQYSSPAFARYPLRVQAVPNRTAALAQQKERCWRDGLTFVADLKHGGGPTMGIAHFAKRILRLHGLLHHWLAHWLWQWILLLSATLLAAAKAQAQTSHN